MMAEYTNDLPLQMISEYTNDLFSAPERSRAYK